MATGLAPLRVSLIKKQLVKGQVSVSHIIYCGPKAFAGIPVPIASSSLLTFWHLAGMVNVRPNAFTLRILRKHSTYWLEYVNLPICKEPELFGLNYNRLSPIITGELTVEEKMIYELNVNHRCTLVSFIYITPNIRRVKGLNFVSLVHCKF